MYPPPPMHYCNSYAGHPGMQQQSSELQQYQLWHDVVELKRQIKELRAEIDHLKNGTQP